MFRDVVAAVDAGHLSWRDSHVDVEGEDKVCRGFEGEEGAMRSIMRRMFARSHETCCCLCLHSEGFMVASYVFANISNSSRGPHVSGEVGNLKNCEQRAGA